MNHYYLVIMHRKTREVMVILKCYRKHVPSIVVETYAIWNGVEPRDLLYKEVRCGDYEDILVGKDFL